MGMGSAPCHGFVRKADEKLLKFLGITKLMVLDKIEELGAGTDPLDPLEVITDLLQSGHGPELTIGDARFFIYDGENGDRYDDLEDGQLYVIFDESDLWEKKPTAFLTRLKKAGLEPEECQWTNFG